MKRVTVILQTVFILLIWYAAYGTEIVRKANTGEWGIHGKLLIYFLPLVVIGFILGADGLIDGIREKARIYKLNVAIWILLVIGLAVIFFAISGKFSWMNEMNDSIIYLQLRLSDIFGIGTYCAVGLCAGHMLGSFAGKDKQNIIVNYAVVIALWFVSYDILYPVTETAAKVGENYSISLLVLVLPMFLTGIILRVRHFGRRKEKQPLDKVNLIVLAVVVAAAAIALILKPYFLFGTHIYLMLCLGAGNILMMCRKKA